MEAQRSEKQEGIAALTGPVKEGHEGGHGRCGIRPLALLATTGLFLALQGVAASSALLLDDAADTLDR